MKVCCFLGGLRCDDDVVTFIMRYDKLVFSMIIVISPNISGTQNGGTHLCKQYVRLM